MRLFFAIGLSEAWGLWSHLDACAEMFAAAGYRMTPRANLHLTLNFVGDADADSARQLVERCASVSALPFVITLGGHLLALPSPRHPRVLAYGVTSGRDELANLARQVGYADSQSFLAHVTVAKAKGGAGLLPAVPVFRPIEFMVNSYCLMNSELGQGCAAYNVVREFPLR